MVKKYGWKKYLDLLLNVWSAGDSCVVLHRCSLLSRAHIHVAATLVIHTVFTHYHINLSVGVAHVAHNAAILHSVQLLPGDNVLIACKTQKQNIQLAKIKVNVKGLKKSNICCLLYKQIYNNV